MEVHVSAPGKVILHGEHSVVYGRLAVAASLGLRTNLKLKETNADDLVMIFRAVGLNIKFNIQELKTALLEPSLANFDNYNFEYPEKFNQTALLESINKFLDERHGSLDAVKKICVSTVLYFYTCMLFPSGIPLKGMELAVESELQIGAGMGSSASFCIVLAAGIMEYIKRNIDKHPAKISQTFNWLRENPDKSLSQRELNSINSWAYQAEHITHGNPSGIDNTTCTYGSIVEFRKGSKPKALRVSHKLSALLIDTNVSRNTKVLLTRVVDLLKQVPTLENVLDGMDVISRKAIDNLAKLSDLEVKYGSEKAGHVEEFKEYYDRLEEYFELNQLLLATLDVSHPEIEKILSILRKHDFVGKLTGAGGGGFVLAIVPFYAKNYSIERVKHALTEAGYPFHLLELGGDGVKIH